MAFLKYKLHDNHLFLLQIIIKSNLYTRPGK
jgi:hypothetical protein